MSNKLQQTAYNLIDNTDTYSVERKELLKTIIDVLMLKENGKSTT